MQLMHPPPGKDDTTVFDAHVLEEERNVKYLTIKQYFQTKLFKGTRKGKQWYVVTFRTRYYM